ncbi:MAG: YidC/Oxa1 family membrane protein insertase [Clostridia bacterium]|nr:YidC/Oxa1 family membrane protein insertase [Clostridia bacterium]
MDLFSLLITKPLGFLINMIYKYVQNYGLAIIIFTVIIKLVLLPLTVKSQKSMKKQQKLQPALAELQKKYANDKEKLQLEMMKLYKENDVSMSGGCLPMLVQMPILIGLYQVIQKPLSFLIGVNFNSEAAINKVIDIQQRMIEQFPNVIGRLSSATMEQLANTSQIQLSTWSEKLNGASDAWVINFNFFGMNLSNVPTMAISNLLTGKFDDLGTLLLLLIPIVAIATTWVSMKLSQAQTKPANEKDEDNPAVQMTKSMSMMMPAMTGFFTLTFPSGIGLYWIIANVVQIAQQYFLNKYFDRKEDEIDVKVPESNRKKRKKR